MSLTALAGVDGNFLDRIRALELAVEELSRKDVEVPLLSDLTSDAGEITSGRFVATDSGVSDPSDTGFSGSYIDSNGFSTTAGASNYNRYKFNNSGTEVANLADLYTLNSANDLSINAYKIGTETPSILLNAGSASLALYHDIASGLQYMTKDAQLSSVFYGSSGIYATYSNSAAANTIISKTIKANALGTKGTVLSHVVVRLINGASGSTRNITIDVSFGGTSLFSYSGFTAAILQNRSGIIELWVAIANQASASAQVASITAIDGASLILGTGVTATNTPRNGANTATVATTSDQTLLVTGTMSAANAALSFEVIVADVFGPYYG